MKYLKFILFVMSVPFFLLLDCNEHNNIVEPPPNTPKDTISIQIAEGIFTELQLLQDSYSLDEEINFQILVYNISDSAGFEIGYGYLQAYMWSVYNEGGDSIMWGPRVLTPAGFYSKLEIGDTLIFNLSWDQRIQSESKGISDLKTFSENYYLRCQPLGNDLFRLMTKYFKITDVGIPLSANVDQDYEIEDTLKFQFTLRNRIKDLLQCNIPSPNPIEVSFVQLQDTALIQYFPLSSNLLQLQPHSDNTIFYYQTAIQDSVFNNLSGAYKVITSISIDNYKLSSYCYGFF
jgi:hypothetical protein